MNKNILSLRLKHLIGVIILSSAFTFQSIGQYTAAPDSTQQQKAKQTILYQPVTPRSFIIPAASITLGFLGVHSDVIVSNGEVKEERDEHFIRFHTSIDNYLQFAPIAAGYGMLIGNKEHRFWPYTKKIVLAEGLMLAMVYPIKKWVGEPRPDNSANNSFPSGHTAQAFAGATIFADEFGRHRFWLQAASYTSATAVAALRVLNNRHWAGDVIAGAGFGILSAKLSEWIIEPHGRKVYRNNFQKL